MTSKKILITGATGFIGKNLTATLLQKGYTNLYLFDRENTQEQLEEFCTDADFVFHLAGVNRPQDTKEFYEGNTDFSKTLLDTLAAKGNKAPVVVSSSIQALLDNDYGKSKKMGEELFMANGANPAFIVRLYGVFGKWSRPNYNTVVATFMHNVAHGLPLQINDPDKELTLCYIDDVIAKFIDILENTQDYKPGFFEIDTLHKITLGKLAEKITAFGKNRETLVMPSLNTLLDQRLYGTYLSYLDTDNFSYKLKKNEDNRGWLAEFIRSESFGQIFISTTKPGITRGDHWHHTKVEKFFVISGKAEISFRHMITDDIIRYTVEGDTPTVVDIPVGYTHNIKNIGDTEVICLFWSSQLFDPQNPDTYYTKVDK
ncbi:MAG: NAD-dependent epimerase/dehydratase family protein [Oscillospiraceae bacterium]|nr:NAD-dependent epimerase/dehydratase family protein [Oscillospiraceae bacterium]MBQ7006677.1 NAD-dependent epimerase/dehydratase family protein [Oscillospiraceae bacterium]